MPTAHLDPDSEQNPHPSLGQPEEGKDFGRTYRRKAIRISNSIATSENSSIEYRNQ